MHFLVLLGAAANILGTSFYVRDTIRGTTKPNRVTWLLWSVIPFIAFAAELEVGIGWSVISVFVAGFTPFMVFCASFVNKQAFWKLGLLDYVCGFLSITAVVLWQYTKNPGYAIAFSILGDGLAAIPTMVKAWKRPETESGSTFLGGLMSSATGIIALPAYTFNGLAFLLYVFAQNSTMLYFIYGRKRASR